jgi:hypothetical protein
MSGSCRLWVGVVASAMALGACANSLLSPDVLVGSPGEVRSQVSGNRLVAELSTRVFVPSEAGVADIYLTDLPEELLRGGGDLSGVSGTVVHLHSFALPEAGKTPIASTATTAAVRVLVLAEGRAGLYAGGGFFRPDREKATGKRFGGTLRGATLYLSHATPGFNDLLGPSSLSGGFVASNDPELVASLQRVLDAANDAMRQAR